MKQYIRKFFPAEFSNHPSYWRALALAAIFLFLSISQLFMYEKFGEVIRGLDLPGGSVTVVFLAVVLPLLEALSLPYLLSMKLRERWRAWSRIAVIMLPSIWLIITVATNVLRSAIDNAGLFGATIPVANGIWSIVFAGLLLWSAILITRELPERL